MIIKRPNTSDVWKSAVITILHNMVQECLKTFDSNTGISNKQNPQNPFAIFNKCYLLNFEHLQNIMPKKTTQLINKLVSAHEEITSITMPPELKDDLFDWIEYADRYRDLNKACEKNLAKLLKE